MRTCANKIVVALVASALALGSSVARAEDAPEMAEAKRQFQAGVNLLDDPDGAKYEEAYHAFKKAHALSQNPKVLGNIAFCAFHLERDGEAIEAYSAYLREATDIEEHERAQIQKDLATLTSTTARVHVVVKNPGRLGRSFVLVDTRTQTRGPSVENSYPFEGTELTVRVRPGRHTLKVKAGGTDSTPVEVAVEPAGQVSQDITFPPPKTSAVVVTRESPSMAGPVILAAGGVLGLGAGVATGLLARSKSADISASCPNDVCPSTYDLDGEKDKAKTFGTVADVGFVAGGALLGGALLWWALLPKSNAARGTTSASAMCTDKGCGLQLQRGF